MIGAALATERRPVAFALTKMLQINRSMPVKSMRFSALKLFQMPELRSSLILEKSNLLRLNFSSGVMRADIKMVLKKTKRLATSAEMAIYEINGLKKKKSATMRAARIALEMAFLMESR